MKFGMSGILTMHNTIGTIKQFYYKSFSSLVIEALNCINYIIYKSIQNFNKHMGLYIMLAI